MFKKEWQAETKQHRWMLCFLAAFSLSLSARTLIFPHLSLPITCISVIIILIFAFAMLKRQLRLIATVALGIGVGIAYFTAFSAVLYQPQIDKLTGNNNISLEVTSYSEGINDYGTGEGTIFALNGEKCNSQRVKIYFSDGTPDFSPGQKLSFSAELSESQRPQDGVFINASQRGDITDISDGKISVTSRFAIFSHSIAGKIDEMAGGDGALLLKALLCGDKSDFSQDFKNALSRSGTSHITAVSGMHISIVMAFIMLLFGKKIGVFVALPVIIMFAMMTGFSYSVMRAVIMASLTILAFILKRENDTLTAVVTALAILLCINPFSIGSISLLLSFGAVLGIVLFCPMLTTLFTVRLPKNALVSKALHYILSCTAASISALIFTMPISMIFFSTTSLVSIISNILILWAITLIMGLGIIAVALAFLFKPLGQIVFTFALMPITNGAVYIIYAMAKLPFSAISASSSYFIAWIVMAEIVFLYFLYKKKINTFLLLGIGAAFILCGGVFMVESRCTEQISILNTDGSAAILVKNGNRPIIINCGSARGGRNFNRIQNQLFDWGSSGADTLLLTSLNSANAGGTDYIIGNNLAQRIYAPKGDTQVTESTHLTYENSGDMALHSGNIQLYKAAEGAFLSLVDTEKTSILNTCGLEPMSAMMAVWDNKLQADIVIIDDKMMQTPYAIEQICRVAAPQMLVCANSGYSYISGVERVFAGQVVDLKQLEKIEIKHWVG